MINHGVPRIACRQCAHVFGCCVVDFVNRQYAQFSFVDVLSVTPVTYRVRPTWNLFKGGMLRKGSYPMTFPKSLTFGFLVGVVVVVAVVAVETSPPTADAYPHK